MAEAATAQKALKEATGLANATIYRARQELKDMNLIVTEKEIVPGRRNKKPKIWVELQDLPVNKIELKQRRDKAHKDITVKKVKKRRSEFIEQDRPLCERRYIPPDWMREKLERLKRERKAKEAYV